MSTHVTSSGSTVEINGTTVSITSKRGTITGTIRPGQYLKPVPSTAVDLIAAGKKAGIDCLYGWWEGKTMGEEMALILNAAIAAITPAPTEAELALEAINAKRAKMIAAINRGLQGADSEAAHDCYDIDMQRVDSWHKRQIAAWAIAYPAAADASAKSVHVAKVKADIADLEGLAKGALTYDADGWISSDEQVRRHDAYMAEADALRKTL